jgi:hypothetical protein
MHFIKWLFVLILPLLYHEYSFAQKQSLQLTPAIKAEIVDSVSTWLIKNYVSPDTAVSISNHIKDRLKTGAYDKLSEAADFAETLNWDMWSVNRDLHLQVNYDPAPQLSYMQEVIKKIKEDKQRNYGFAKVERLDGNIGYIRMTGFSDLNDQSKEVVDGAFSFLKSSDALIIDLRTSGGGQPDMVKYISSYFFKQKTHIEDHHNLRKNEIIQLWTKPHPNSVVFADMPLYILISYATFSAAEELPYDLQSQHRAIIVGEATAGGAHGTQGMPIKYGFMVNIPLAYSVNPITKTNWEKVGVQPDIKTDPDSALHAAMIDFYQHQPPAIKDSLIAVANFRRLVTYSKLHPYAISLSALKAFVGNYKERRITLENGRLYFNAPNTYKTNLTPFSSTSFTLDERLMEFHKDAKGNINEMRLIYATGRVEKFYRK